MQERDKTMTESKKVMRRGSRAKDELNSGVHKGETEMVTGTEAASCR